jgi:hypothetical protein
MATDQYLRKCSLIVATGEQGLELSELRIQFKIEQSDLDSPNKAIIRVFNLSPTTAQRVQKEFQRVVLQGGYQTGKFGVLFDGTVKQVRRGRIDQTNTYLDILAADGDVAYNQGIVNKVMAAGSTAKQRLDTISQAMDLPVGYSADLPSGALSRGKVMFGMGRDYLRDLTNTTGTTWSIQNGKVVVLPLGGYLPGEAVKISSGTGMIGLPEQTEQGIEVKVLLNPALRIGGLVQIDNASIQRAFLPVNLFTPGEITQEKFPNLYPKVTDDGFYRIYVAEHEGDTRGVPWYTNLVCLAIDKSAPASSAVLSKE